MEIMEESKNEENETKYALIVLTIVGAILITLVVVCVLCICCWAFKKKNKNQAEDEEESKSNSTKNPKKSAPKKINALVTDQKDPELHQKLRKALA
jgi:heme/copper-type cytochrome/quinol oxidase subunit 2